MAEPSLSHDKVTTSQFDVDERIAEKDAEIARLREALQAIANVEEPWHADRLSGEEIIMAALGNARSIARAALNRKEGDDNAL